MLGGAPATRGEDGPRMTDGGSRPRRPSARSLTRLSRPTPPVLSVSGTARTDRAGAAGASSGSTEPPVKSPQPDGQLQRRSFLRRSFDFYEDQIAYLTKVSLEERLAGKDSSMNAMLREAVDDYIKKRTHGK